MVQKENHFSTVALAARGHHQGTVGAGTSEIMNSSDV